MRRRLACGSWGAPEPRVNFCSRGTPSDDTFSVKLKKFLVSVAQDISTYKRFETLDICPFWASTRVPWYRKQSRRDTPPYQNKRHATEGGCLSVYRSRSAHPTFSFLHLVASIRICILGRESQLCMSHGFTDEFTDEINESLVCRPSIVLVCLSVSLHTNKTR
jgi:hypothetical protein